MLLDHPLVHPKRSFIFTNPHTMSSKISSIFLPYPLFIGIKKAGHRGPLMRGQLLAKPSQLRPPPILRQLFQLLHLQLRRFELQFPQLSGVKVLVRFKPSCFSIGSSFVHQVFDESPS
uniref:Uncharacterized protein n=1 Tax=Opuntia streptacantha TaxID=393608 RepID=A0A7C9EJ42_OPUST